jgi:hypothetical protein
MTLFIALLLLHHADMWEPRYIFAAVVLWIAHHIWYAAGGLRGSR